MSRKPELKGPDRPAKRAARPSPARRQPGPSLDVDARRLVHELQVHQVELEMQNEELRTARSEVEAALERYTALFDFAPIGYARLTPVGAIREINLIGASFFGLERRYLIGRPFLSFLADRDCQRFRELTRTALGGDGSQTAELALRTQGSPLFVRLTMSALGRSADQNLLVAFEDITERMAKERALAQSEQALREGDERKNEFIAMLSHEIRNPLAAIRGGLTVLARAAPETDQAKRAQLILERQSRHLARLVDELLDVTRIRRGKVQLRLSRLELGDLLRRTVEDNAASFQLKGIELNLSIEEEPLWVDADSVRLVQIVSNLLGNAEKFTPSGGQVTVRVRRDESSVWLSVSDTGMGVPPELLGHLFEPFSQGPQALDRTQGGLGLGLAVTRGLVELHGGTIRAESPGLDRGTEFTVTLPLKPAPPPRARPAARPVTRPRRVLVIEDNADFAEILSDALRLGGHEVDVAFEGSEGLRHACEFHPEIVMCDLGLPGMSGYDVAQAFRNNPDLQDVHLVALTGYTQPETILKAKQAGFDEHIAKPPSLERLNQLLDEAPSSRSALVH